jgi:hypothetical protein
LKNEIKELKQIAIKRKGTKSSIKLNKIKKMREEIKK